MIKLVQECDYCQEQVDWEGMRKDAIPDGWRVIAIVVKTSEGETADSGRYVICDKHGNDKLSTILGTIVNS